MVRRILVAAVAAAFAAAAQAQQPIEVKVAEFVGPQHFMTKWIMQWGEKLEKASNGKLVFKHFPGAQMAPTPAHYDLARTGQADVSWFLHGGTPGRFPLTEISHLPYMVGSAEIGTKVLNDRELRSKYLDAEHKGVKVLLLFTHQPGNVHTTKKPIRTADDMKGLRIRFSSPTIKDFVAALGGTAVGVQPNEQLEQLQKGTLDGTFIDYGGAGVAFKMGGTLKYSTEMYSYVSSFGLAMNPEFYNKLPRGPEEAPRAVRGRRREGSRRGLGRARHDRQEAHRRRRRPGDHALQVRGPALPQGRRAGDRGEAEGARGQGLPARAVHKTMTELSAKHAQTSKNFWK